MRTLKRPSVVGFVCAIAIFISFQAVFGSNLYAQKQTSSDLLDYFVQARTAKLAELDQRDGFNRLILRELDPLGIMSDTVRAWVEGLRFLQFMENLPPALETFGIQEWTKIDSAQIATHRLGFEQTQWAFTGSNSRSTLDTTRTSHLRSLLEFQFGAPTVTLAEMESPELLPKERIVEFEYWFMVNDSIHVIVMDVNGPWDRGIVLAADMNYRSELRKIKRSLLEQLIERANRKQFTDYYFNYDQQVWYLTGFDGASFFDVRIEPPDLTLGRPKTIKMESAEGELPENK